MSLTKIAKDLITGKLEYSSESLKDSRSEICESCPEKVKGLNMCGICYCYIPTKTSIKTETCPKGKW